MYFIHSFDNGSTRYYALRAGSLAAAPDGASSVVSIKCVNYVGVAKHLNCQWRGRVFFHGETANHLVNRLTEANISTCEVRTRSRVSHSRLCSLLQYLRTFRNIGPGQPWARCSPSVQNAVDRLVRDYGDEPPVGLLKTEPTVEYIEETNDNGVAGVLDHRPSPQLDSNDDDFYLIDAAPATPTI